MWQRRLSLLAGVSVSCFTVSHVACAEHDTLRTASGASLEAIRKALMPYRGKEKAIRQQWEGISRTQLLHVLCILASCANQTMRSSTGASFPKRLGRCTRSEPNNFLYRYRAEYQIDIECTCTAQRRSDPNLARSVA